MRAGVCAGAACGVRGIGLSVAADALAFAGDLRPLGVAAGLVAGAAGIGAPPGSAAAWLPPVTDKVLIGRGSLLGRMPLALAICDIAPDPGGGAPFWLVWGNTTRGLLPPRPFRSRVLRSMGVSSRDTSFSPPSLPSSRSGTLGIVLSCCPMILVGLLSARMIGGSPVRPA